MLLNRKSDEELVGEAKVWRSTVREDRHTPTLQITIGHRTMILPYSYFQKACFNGEGNAELVELYWPSAVIAVEGVNLNRLVQLVAEHGLALLEFQPDGHRHTREDRPEFESVILTPRSEYPLPSAAAVKSPRQPRIVIPSECYSISV